MRTTLPDGRTVEYNDVTNPLTAEEIAHATKKTMDCVDCHNRAGHPFPSPEELVDEAIAQGRLSKDLPYVKKEMVDAVVGRATPTRKRPGRPWARSRSSTRPRTPRRRPSIRRRDQAGAALARELMDRLVFEEPGVTWQSFPDDIGAQGFPRLFPLPRRQAPERRRRVDPAALQHLPQHPGDGRRRRTRPPQMPVASVQEPPTHLETNFMADHRFLASQEACGDCHGEIKFGTDNSSFCANSACHGRAWPEVKLNAAFPHPIELDGKHAEVWCNDCHEGVVKPEYKCANCHQPPMAAALWRPVRAVPHAGRLRPGDPGRLSASRPAGREACRDCSARPATQAGKTLEYKCANCHQPPSEPHFGADCEKCHTPTGFEEATIPPELHPMPLIGAHLRATCEVCHAEGQRVPEYVCSNCHKPPADHFGQPCDQCHTPEGWAESAAAKVNAPEIPHTLEGMDNCLVCHDPAGTIKPAPANHTAFTLEQCTLCHKAED